MIIKSDTPELPRFDTYPSLRGGLGCVDFVNSTVSHDPSGTVSSWDALAPGYANALGWLTYIGAVDDDQARTLLRLAGKQPREAATVRRRAVALREALYRVMVAMIAQTPPDPADLAVIDEEEQRAVGMSRLAYTGDRVARVWTTDRELDRPLWPIVTGATELLASPQVARLGQCQAEGCQQLFLDTSKNRSRRFCSASECGTLTRVRNHRARHLG